MIRESSFLTKTVTHTKRWKRKGLRPDKVKVKTYQIPDRNLYLMNDSLNSLRMTFQREINDHFNIPRQVLYGHPSIIKEMRKQLKEQNDKIFY